MSRKQAYKLMQSLMNMDEKEAHIGKFDVEQCNQKIKAALDLVNKILAESIENPTDN